MISKNSKIVLRRNAISEMIKSNYSIKEIRRIMLEYKCNRSAIYFDIGYLNINGKSNLIVSNSLKIKIHERDNNTCQYCGALNDKMLIDHVIPFTMDSSSNEFNLVCCCYSCNLLKKGKHVWVPNNINELEKINPQWADKIRSLDTKNKLSLMASYLARFHKLPKLRNLHLMQNVY